LSENYSTGEKEKKGIGVNDRENITEETHHHVQLISGESTFSAYLKEGWGNAAQRWGENSSKTPNIWGFSSYPLGNYFLNATRGTGQKGREDARGSVGSLL